MDYTETPKNIQIVNLIDTTHTHESITSKKMEDLPKRYIQSAALYTRLCGKIEYQYQQQASNLSEDEQDEIQIEHDAHAISSILLSVAFLEGTINTFFENAQELFERLDSTSFINTPPDTKMVYGLLDSQSIQQFLMTMAKIGLDAKGYAPVYEKFDDILKSCGKEQFKRGEEPFQDVPLLCNLRNALIHYKPTWVTIFTSVPLAEEVDNNKLKALQKKKLPRNPFHQGGEREFFPMHCLSYGHAQWAVATSILFAEEFFKKMNLPCPFDHIKHRLKTEV